MEETELFSPERRPRRHHRTQSEIFKEQYLPYLILLAAALLILLLIFGALGRNAEAAAQTAAVFAARRC